LTKPLGTGALVAAHRKGLVPIGSEDYQTLIRTMTTLNKAGLLLADLGAHACTDVTGFGLTGHALEMATAADVTLIFETGSLPLLPNAVGLCGAGFTCGGTTSNAAFTQAAMTCSENLREDWLGLLNDPQTSGGLLIAVPQERCERLKDALLADGALAATVIGEVRTHATGAPYLQFL
jgi:selenide,water dikinase